MAMKIDELRRIDQHIDKTASNKFPKVSEGSFETLKKYLIDKLTECVTSGNAEVRRTSVQVTRKFLALSKDHQSRALEEISNRYNT